jgi:hypothetical protein
MEAKRGDALRHKIVVIIPVADRPQHLGNILASLDELCRTFDYGRGRDGCFSQVAVVVADDSADDEAIRRHQAIARDADAGGLPVTYFGAAEQSQLLHSLSAPQRQALRRIVGEPERSGFRHKGASVTRNLASLLALRMSAGADDCLFHFVDSDEQFKVRIAGTPEDEDVAAIDYFRCLDRIFSDGDVEVLTGKVVGDPPVSPAVMAGNFLGDVIGLLKQMAAAGPDRPCSFHGERRAADDAAYHDMAELFGFAPKEEAFGYRCTLVGAHDHARCLADFSAKLDRFFDGEHPTRSSTFTPGGDCLATRPARTVYTGNYVCARAGLAHFIPFAPLKLRMAGPVLGRLIRAEIGARFVSADLPLLHTRTARGTAEFRPGVSRQAAEVDLSGEFERQFFGDLMLFTIERLVEAGYPARTVPREDIERTLDEVEHMLRGKYDDMRVQVAASLDRARARFDDPSLWWNTRPDLADARANFHRFFDNIDRNFGADARGYRLIGDDAHRAGRRDEIAQAIAGLADDRRAWREALGSQP